MRTGFPEKVEFNAKSTGRCIGSMDRFYRVELSLDTVECRSVRKRKHDDNNCLVKDDYDDENLVNYNFIGNRQETHRDDLGLLVQAVKSFMEVIEKAPAERSNALYGEEWYALLCLSG